ncbi:MAG TPA: UvrD-helicase domain-containing protein [Solirubrobacteraceae bacterium]|nr:UvrD-helicase domain-containing protein [Solirubrobacteraceae bacterium]
MPVRMTAASKGPGSWAPTTEQAAAIARRRGSLVLSANAGSGKTSVLVERFVAAVLEDGVSPAQILAITFTDRAAGELRQRVRARLLELGAREQARDAEGAFVLTVHAFCLRVLRAHPLAAGLDPDFRLLEPGVAQRLSELAFEDALARLLDGPQASEGLDLVAAFGVDRLAGTTRAVYEELRSRGARTPTLPEAPAVGDPAARRLDLLEAAHALAETLAETVGGQAGNGGVASVQRALDTAERCRALLASLSAADLPAAAQLADLKVAAGNTRALGSPEAQRYREARDAFEQVCADHRAAAAARLLDTLLRDYGGAYAARKRARSAVDFDDLELEASSLLWSSPALRDSWRERFELIMVDEFQDTNRRQLALIAALDRDNVFTVGDELQSIYGFRHADVTIFSERRHDLAARGSALTLAENFRSSAGLLETINAVFAPLFADFTPLVAGGGRGADADADAVGRADAPEPPEPAVELLLTDSDGWEDTELDPELGLGLPPAAAWRHAEARLLAQRIAELVDGGEPPGEIAVLVRATGDLGTYERAIEDVGLPTLAAGGGGYWSQQQVQDLTRYLAVLANPLDERALVEMLGSPLVGVSPDGLALVALAAREAGGTVAALFSSEAAILLGTDDPVLLGTDDPRVVADRIGAAGARGLDALATPDRERLERLAAWLGAERRLLPRLGLDVVLERAIEHSAYDLHVLGLPAGERRMANVHKLMRLAREFERSEGRELASFVEHVRAQERRGARDPEAPVEDAQLAAVRLLTMHAAKGLEFPVVCLADLGRLGQTDTGPLLVDGQRLGLRVPRSDGGPALAALDYEPLRAERLKRMVDEERRVLYVAMTRARRRLVLSGAVSLGRWPDQRPGACPLSWLGPALVDGLPGSLPAGPGRQPIATARGPYTARLWLTVNRADGASRALAPASRATGGFEQLKLTEIAAPLPRAPAPPVPEPARLPIRSLSYSSLGELERCAYRFYVQRMLGLPDVAPPPASAESGLDARARGVLVHALLEQMDFVQEQVADAEQVRACARTQGLRPGAHDVAQLVGLLQAFAASPLRARLGAAEDLRREHPFTLSLPSPHRPLVTGVIDVLGIEADGATLVVDYKSDRLPAELTAHVEEHYLTQRSIYALAVLSAGAPAVEVVHCFLERPHDLVSRRFTAGDLGALQRELEGLADRASSGVYPVTEMPHRELCQTCPARQRLCRWEEGMTLRELPTFPAGR